MGDDSREFTVRIGKSAKAKHEFRVGDEVSGECEPAVTPEIEPAEFYKVAKLKLVTRGSSLEQEPPPWHGIPPALETYRQRGHRRLSAKVFESKCSSCIWGCKMAAEMIIDQWNPDKRKYREETFCYGPKSCRLYKAGPTRKVPGRKGMSWEEEDWVDEEATAHRGDDD